MKNAVCTVFVLQDAVFHACMKAFTRTVSCSCSIVQCLVYVQCVDGRVLSYRWYQYPRLRKLL